MPEHSQLFRTIEIIIADGTDVQDKSNSTKVTLLSEISLLTNRLSQRTSIRFVRHPGIGFLERLGWLSAQARGDYVTLVGDEDMLVFDSISDWLDELDQQTDLAAIAGQYVNIKGFERFGTRLKILMEEGLVNGVTIDANDVESRLIQWISLGVAGLPPISYALVRQNIFKSFGTLIDRFSCDLTYSGAEILLNLFTLGEGKISVKNSPYVIRDFTYIGHTSSFDSNWSDETRDMETWRESLKCLDYKYDCFSSDVELQKFGDLLWRFYEFGKPARFIALKNLALCQQALGQQLRNKITNSSLRAATLTWLETADKCYKSSDLPVVGLRPSLLAPFFLRRMILRFVL